MRMSSSATVEGRIEAVVTTLVAGVRSRCWSVKLWRILDALGIDVGDGQARGGLVRVAAQVLRHAGVDGCEVVKHGNGVVFVRCCADTPNEVVERFRKVIGIVYGAAIKHMLHQHGPAPDST